MSKLKKFGKKALSLLVCAVFALTSFGVAAVFADGITVVADEDFSSDDSYSTVALETINDLSTGSNGSVSFPENPSPLYGKVFQFSQPNGQRNELCFKLNNPITLSDKTDSDYAEISYDMSNSSKTRTGNMWLRDGRNANVVINATIDKNGTAAVGGKTVATGAKGMHNIRIQLNLGSKKITRVWFDGVLSDVVSDIAFTNQKDINYIQFGFGRKSDSDSVMQFDNVSIVTYRSEDGTSPIADRAALRAKIGDAVALAANPPETATEEQIAALNTAINAAAAAHRNITAAQTDIDAALENLQSAMDECGKLPPREDSPFSLYEGFDDGPDGDFAMVPTVGTAETAAFDSKQYGGTAFRFTADDTAVNKGQYAEFAFADNAVDFNNENPDCYVETTVDFSTFNLSAYSKGYYFQLMDSHTAAVLADIYVVKGINININRKVGGNTVTTLLKSGIDPSVMQSLRIVMRVTDESGAKSACITGIYINGVLADAEGGSLYPLAVEGTGYDTVRMRVSNVKDADNGQQMEYGFYADNLSVTKYYAHDGEIPVTKGKLAEKLRLFDTLREANAASGAYNSAANEKALAAIEKQSAVLADKSATADDISAAVTELEILEKKLSLTGRKSLEMLDPTAKRTESEIEITVPFVTAESAKSMSPTAVAALCKKAGGEDDAVLSAAAATVSMTADDYKEANIVFDLSSYGAAERDELFVKVFAFENITKPETHLDTAVYLFADAAEPSVSTAANLIGKADVYSAIGGAPYIEALTDGGKALFMVLGGDTTADKLNDTNFAAGVKYIGMKTSEKSDEKIVWRTSALPLGTYNTCVAVGGETVNGRVQIGDSDAVSAAIAAVKNGATAQTIADNRFLLGYGGDIYDTAANSGADIAAMMAEVAENTVYDTSSVRPVAEKFMAALSLVSGIRNAANADTADTVLNKYSFLVSNYSKYVVLGGTAKINAAAKLCELRGDVTAIASLETALDTAVAYAAAQTAGSSSTGGGGGGGGSKSSFGSSPVITPGASLPTGGTAVDAAVVFGDISGCEWARTAIAMLTAKGSIGGKAEGIFAPDDSITREEFIKIIMLTFDYGVSDSATNFDDAPAGAWYTPYISRAVGSGIVSGISDTYFGTGSNVTRQDAAVLLYRVMTDKKANFTENGEYIEFVDGGTIADYAAEAVEKLTKSGIVNGTDGNRFLPCGSCTRAEAAKLIYEVYSFMAAKGGITNEQV